MVQKQKPPEDIFPCKDYVLIAQYKHADRRTKIDDSLDTLLIYEGDQIVKREPIRKMSPGCRYCKGYFPYEMNFLK